jgi:HEAT repeat protein
LKAVLAELNNPDVDIRNYAVRAVGKMRSPEAIQPLAKILQEDSDDQVKTSAASSLVMIGKPAVAPLLKLLEKSESMGLTIRLVQVLGEIGDKRAIKPLEKVYNETSNAVLQNATAVALNKID